MDILSALKHEASKLQQQLDTLNSAMKILGGKNNVSRGNGRRRKRHVSAAARAKMARSAGEVGRGESDEEEWLTTPLVPLKITSAGDLSVDFVRGASGMI